MIKLATYAQRFVMNESMTLQIKGEDYTRHDTLWDLSTYLQRIAYSILDKLPEDQKAYFQKNRPAELLTIDGLDDMNDSKKGTLNLYYSGYTKNTLKLILKGVYMTLKKLNVQFGKFRTEQSRTFKYQVVRIPILNISSEYKGAPELNMSNRNAFHIFHNVLQYEAEDDGYYFSFTAKELRDRVESVLMYDPEWIKTHVIHKKDTDMPDAEHVPDNFENPHDWNPDSGSTKGPRLISGGLDEEDIKHRLYAIWDIAEWAIKHGKTELFAS
jgi:hypothetical protein